MPSNTILDCHIRLDYWSVFIVSKTAQHSDTRKRVKRVVVATFNTLGDAITFERKHHTQFDGFRLDHA